MELKKLNGQDVDVAKTLRPGQIVELVYNQDDNMTGVFYKNAYLGSLPAKVNSKFAKILNYNKLVSKYNFDLQVLNISTEQAKEMEDEYLRQKTRKLDEKPKTEKVIEQRKTEEDRIMELSIFETIARALEFHLEARKTSFLSSLHDLFFKQDEVEYGEEWIQEQINRYKRLNPNSESLKRLEAVNRGGKLYSLMKKYWSIRKVKQNSISKVEISTPSLRKPYIVRSTYCWRCKRAISSDSHHKCFRCKWIVCSCGACSNGCR